MRKSTKKEIKPTVRHYHKENVEYSLSITEHLADSRTKHYEISAKAPNSQEALAVIYQLKRLFSIKTATKKEENPRDDSIC